jgi:hypothetical protein
MLRAVHSVRHNSKPGVEEHCTATVAALENMGVEGVSHNAWPPRSRRKRLPSLVHAVSGLRAQESPTTTRSFAGACQVNNQCSIFSRTPGNSVIAHELQARRTNEIQDLHLLLTGGLLVRVQREEPAP